ncbi:MAG: GNAT family N-acetyltransferase [bacterium]|nr:GNAT family N-acetyltransferase [bacterium]
MTQYNFRPAELEDLNPLNDLLYRSKQYWGYDEKFMATFMEHFSVKAFEIPHTIILHSKGDLKILGFHCLLHREDHGPFLENMFVEPTLIGSGLGRRIWNNACAKAQKEGWKSFTFCADPSAENFYKHMGAKTTDVFNSPCAPGRTTPIMEYVL